MKKYVFLLILINCFLLVGSFCSCSTILNKSDGTEKIKDLSYTVEHWQQNISNDEYTKVTDDTQTLFGKTGEKTNAVSKAYEGFTVRPFEQKTLSNTEDIIIKIFYDRNIITYTFDANGGKWESEDKTQMIYKGKFGDYFDAAPDDPYKLSPSNDPIKVTEEVDYKLSGWDKDIPETYGVADITFNALWEEDKILYTIKYYKENVDEGFTFLEDETEIRKLQRMYSDCDVVNISDKSYKGFYQSAFLSADNVICVKFYRNTYVYTFDANGGSWIENNGGATILKSVEGKYEQTVSITPPVHSDYVFSGWALENTLDTAEFESSNNIKFCPDYRTFYAVWKPLNLTTPTLTIISGGDVVISADGYTFTATPTINDIYTYEWYLDETKLLSESNTCILDPTNLSAGYYLLYVKASGLNGINYISCYQLTVQ